MSIVVDLNADLGEGDEWDAELLAIVSSCNIACGGHAGDHESMQVTVAAAIKSKVAIGAHPSYPDREGFGRRAEFLAGSEILHSLREQLAALSSVCAASGVAITHVKPHGALYRDATADPALAEILISSFGVLPAKPSLVGPPGGAMCELAATRGINYVREAFIDRAYGSDGQLVPRSVANAVHTDLDVIATQAVSIAVRKRVCLPGGEKVPMVVDTLCVHGDTPGAAAIARYVRSALQQEGVVIRAVGS